MNDPNKRIDVNLSSLLSLKAELLRKHQEVNKTKLSQQNQIPAPAVASAQNKSKKSTQSKRNKETKTASDAPKTTVLADTYAEAELLQKSKRVLEAKSKFYDRMSRAGGSLNSDENCLVMFNRKKQQTEGLRGRYETSSSSSPASSDEDEAEDGDWVEYTDCLGRTRKCLKEDLASVKERDKELAKTVGTPAPVPEHTFVEPAAAPADRWYIDNCGESSVLAGARHPASSSDDDDDDGADAAADRDDTQSMISKSSKADEMRSNWERQETENANKESIHYQDVLFDEARSHGTGYYAFSTDDAERTKQQRDLEAQRQQTLDAQRSRDQQRSARERIIADRVRAAQNRQRARAGLPPLPEVPVDAPVATTISDAPSGGASGAKAARKEAKRVRKAAAEAERRAAERLQHIRPWDKGKDGVRSTSDAGARAEKGNGDSDDDSDGTVKPPTEWAYKPEREPMSQEQWNELLRAERRSEFAPIVDLPIDDPMPATEYGFQARSTTKRKAPPAAAMAPDINITARTPANPFNKPFVRRNVEPDRNDSDQGDVSDEVDYNIEPPGASEQRPAEFAPPATFEYYGPSGAGSASKQSRPNPGMVARQLENSIEAGLRFLRDQSDKSMVGTKEKWSSNAGY